MKNVCRMTIFTVLLLSITVGGAFAAEINLRSEAIVAGHIVRLGDVAHVYSDVGGDSSGLAAVELFTAPVSEKVKTVSAREIRDLMVLRGVALGKHRVTGASFVRVTRKGETGAPVVRRKIASPLATRRLKSFALRAITAHLTSQFEEKVEWAIDLELTAEQAVSLEKSSGPLGVKIFSNDTIEQPEDLEGVLQCELTVATPGGAKKLQIDVTISLPEAVVVAARQLRRGDLIRSSDVMLSRRGASKNLRKVFHAIEDVVGMEMIGSISPDKPLTESTVRRPVLVKRGQAVTVYVFSPGVRVRTTARARQSGSQGDLITVETMNRERETYAAVVRERGVVVVYANGQNISEEPAENNPSPRVPRKLHAARNDFGDIRRQSIRTDNNTLQQRSRPTEGPIRLETNRTVPITSDDVQKYLTAQAKMSRSGGVIRQSKRDKPGSSIGKRYR